MSKVKAPVGVKSSRRKFLSGAAVAAAATVAGAERRQGPGPDQHAVAEHLAVEGHLSRVRARFRQEGQRHDRRRPEDRGSPRGRRRAGVRTCSTRCRRGHSTAVTACSSTITANRPPSPSGAPGPASPWTRTCCCPGTSTAAARNCSTKLYASIGANVVSFPYGPMPTQPLGWFKKPITKAEDLRRPQVPDGGHLDRRVHRPRRRRQRTARRRDRLGDGPRPAGRGGVQQRLVGPRPRLCRRVEDLHAPELPSERRAVRDLVQQDEVRRACRRR